MGSQRPAWVSVFLRWLPFLVVSTIMSGMIYGAVQQSIRLAADEPQVQMAEDAANLLSAQAIPQLIAPSREVDIGKSLAPYLIIYREDGSPIASSGLLAGRIPRLPAGVVNYLKTHRQDRFTWQPVSGVRSAVVAVRYGGKAPGFVLAGRSLREVERREDRVARITLLGWGLSTLLTLAACIIPATKRE